MFFSKKYTQEISKLRSLIREQGKDIETLKYTIDILDTQCKGNSQSINEIDEDLTQVRKDSETLRLTASHDQQRCISRSSEISQSVEDRISNLSKMQKVIMTWIIVLCTTSLFSFLMHNKII